MNVCSPVIHALPVSFGTIAGSSPTLVRDRTRALKVEPGNPSYLDSLGWAYVKQGNLADADQPLTDAAAQLPGNSVVQDHLGELRFRQQRYADAVAAWERALAGDGESIDRAAIEKKLRDARGRIKQE